MAKKLDDVELRIKSLTGITGFKKSITEHAKVNRELEEYAKEVEELETVVAGIEAGAGDGAGADAGANAGADADTPITDEQYAEYLAEVKILAQIFETLPLEEQVVTYREALRKIRLCDTYLKSRRMEVTYLPTSG